MLVYNALLASVRSWRAVLCPSWVAHLQPLTYPNPWDAVNRRNYNYTHAGM